MYKSPKSFLWPKVLHDLPHPLPASPLLSLVHSALAKWGPFLVLQHARHGPAPGPLHCLECLSCKCLLGSGDLYSSFCLWDFMSTGSGLDALEVWGSHPHVPPKKCDHGFPGMSHNLTTCFVFQASTCLPHESLCKPKHKGKG